MLNDALAYLQQQPDANQLALHNQMQRACQLLGQFYGADLTARCIVFVDNNIARIEQVLSLIQSWNIFIERLKEVHNPDTSQWPVAVRGCINLGQCLNSAG